mmetsp:Transcript_78741/g.231018  ORF Transcript_78741/g.231018 Transcript_78741/m.231018 type:complete len:257 (+) Transcript_78741:500-1270(+)
MERHLNSSWSFGLAGFKCGSTTRTPRSSSRLLGSSCWTTLQPCSSGTRPSPCTWRMGAPTSACGRLPASRCRRWEPPSSGLRLSFRPPTTTPHQSLRTVATALGATGSTSTRAFAVCWRATRARTIRCPRSQPCPGSPLTPGRAPAARCRCAGGRRSGTRRRWRRCARGRRGRWAGSRRRWSCRASRAAWRCTGIALQIQMHSGVQWHDGIQRAQDELLSCGLAWLLPSWQQLQGPPSCGGTSAAAGAARCAPPSS